MASILAVDDDILLLQLIRKILERDGHRVTAVNDPLEVRKLSLSDYSLILLDVMMPGIDGFSLCREIRDLADCPIVFLTAKSGEADVLLGLGLGGDDYLKKPFGAEEIRARVNAHLRREQREKECCGSVRVPFLSGSETDGKGWAGAAPYKRGICDLRIPGTASRTDLVEGTDI